MGHDFNLCISRFDCRSFRAVFFPYIFQFFQVLSQFLYEHLPVTGWTNIAASKFANWPEVFHGFPAKPSCFNQPPPGPSFWGPSRSNLLTSLALEDVCVHWLHPSSLPYRMMLDLPWDEIPKFHPKHITQSEGKLKVIWKMVSRQIFKTVNGFGLQKSINCPDNDVHAFAHASKGNSYHRWANNQLSLGCQTHQLYSIVISSHVLGLPSCFINNLYHLCIMAVFSFSKIYVALPASASICPSCSVGSFLCLAIKAF